MKGVLEFDLNDFEERKEHLHAINGGRAHWALSEIPRNIFRPIHKYEGHDNAEIRKVLEKYPDQLDAFIDLSYAMHGYYCDLLIEEYELAIE